MSVTAGYMVPHPPLIIPEVGQGQQDKIQNTVDAYREAARLAAEQKPETIVVISPHNVMYQDYFHIRPDQKLYGDFSRFRAGQVSMELESDLEFVQELCKGGKEQRWGTLGGREKGLDHGTMIPLYFVNQYYKDYRVVCIGLSGYSLAEHYRLGQAIQRAAETLGRKTVVIASGDLSHYLKKDGPYGFHKEGPEYDRKIMEVMERADFGKLLEFPEDFCERAGECGHRSFVILAGALDRRSVQSRRLSYEGTFGVGYGICTYQVTGEDGTRNFLEQHEEVKRREMSLRRAEEDAYVSLARMTLETYVRTGRMSALPENLPEEMLAQRAGAFVSIHKGGRLRGCIGTIEPVRRNIAEEIRENAVSAGTRDPRFHQVRAEELPDLAYSVDILEKPEKITSLEELDVKKYGVIVSKGRKRGLLLPDLDGVDTVEQQVAVAAQKAGIDPDEPGVELERFRVIRHGEKS